MKMELSSEQEKKLKNARIYRILSCLRQWKDIVTYSDVEGHSN
jgi:hypothetical protein